MNFGNEEMCARYPFIEGLLQADLPPYSPQRPTEVNQLHLNAAVADAELMWRQPDDVGIMSNDSSWIGSGEEPFRQARQGEYLFVVLHGLGLDPEPFVGTPGLGGRPYQYVREALTAYPAGPQGVAALVWVTVLAWYDQPDDRQRKQGHVFGAYAGRELRVTVYEPPTEGFAQLLASSTIVDAYLTTRLVLRGYVRQEPVWVSVSDQLGQLATVFQDRVYRSGLRQIIDASRRRGMSGQFAGIDVRSFVSAGRVMVTLEHESVSVTFLGAEDGDMSLGFHGVGGTLRQVSQLVTQMVQAWESLTPQQRRSMYRDNDNISPW